MTLACVPLVFRPSARQGQLGGRDPVVKLAEGVGAHVPEHLGCESVTNHFANFDRIGMGSSSVVYRAVRLSDNRRVVIKAMRRRGTGEVTLAKREFALLSDLKHPNIIVALDFLESPSCVALVLEDIAGRNLRSVVRSTAAGRLDELSAMRFFVQAVAGLAYLHGRSTVHRDLKPDNFLISKEGVLKIIDFNVASSTEGGELLTPTGTRDFRAPEILNKPYTSSADVWSIGLCLYFMLHGRTPPHDSSDVLTVVQSTASMQTAASDDASDDASDCFSDDDISTPKGPFKRAMTEQPREGWGSSAWALRRCLHEDWRGRASAQELLAGASSWLAGH